MQISLWNKQNHWTMKSFLTLVTGGGALSPVNTSCETLFLPRSKNLLSDWCAIMTRTKETETAQIIGNLEVTNWGMLFEHPEDNASQTKVGFITYKKETAKPGYTIARIPKSVILYFRAIRGRTRGNMIAPDLMGHVAIPYTWKEFLFHRGCSHNVRSILRSGLIAGGRECKEGRQTIFFTPLNLHYEGISKTNQDAVYWINLARARDKGLQFWLRRSHAISVCSFLLADGIFKVISQRQEKTLFERLSTPRPAPKIVLKSYWHSQQQQLPDTLESPTSAGIGKPLRGLQPSTSTFVLTPATIGKPLREGFEPTEEKIRTRVWSRPQNEGIVQDAILNDEDRMGNIQDVGDKLKIGYSPKGTSNRFDAQESQKDLRARQHWIARIGTNIQDCPVQFLLEASTRRTVLLWIRYVSPTWFRNDRKAPHKI